jgi:hypothetical protein
MVYSWGHCYHETILIALGDQFAGSMGTSVLLGETHDNDVPRGTSLQKVGQDPRKDYGRK